MCTHGAALHRNHALRRPVGALLNDDSISETEEAAGTSVQLSLYSRLGEHGFLSSFPPFVVCRGSASCLYPFSEAFAEKDRTTTRMEISPPSTRFHPASNLIIVQYKNASVLTLRLSPAKGTPFAWLQMMPSLGTQVANPCPNNERAPLMPSFPSNVAGRRR